MAVYVYQNPTFVPAYTIISAISQEKNAEITTTTDHNYNDGLIIRLSIPTIFGMTRANSLFSPITVTGDTTFTMNIDTSLFNPFVIPVQPRDRYAALAIPIGEIASSTKSATQNAL